jgi:hypothetical protein
MVFANRYVRCRYKDSAPTELVGERLVDHNVEPTAKADIIVDSAMNSLT